MLDITVILIKKAMLCAIPVVVNSTDQPFNNLDTEVYMAHNQRICKQKFEHYPCVGYFEKGPQNSYLIACGVGYDLGLDK